MADLGVSLPSLLTEAVYPLTALLLKGEIK